MLALLFLKHSCLLYIQTFFLSPKSYGVEIINIFLLMLILRSLEMRLHFLFKSPMIIVVASFDLRKLLNQQFLWNTVALETFDIKAEI